MKLPAQARNGDGTPTDSLSKRKEEESCLYHPPATSCCRSESIHSTAVWSLTTLSLLTLRTTALATKQSVRQPGTNMEYFHSISMWMSWRRLVRALIPSAYSRDLLGRFTPLHENVYLPPFRHDIRLGDLRKFERPFQLFLIPRPHVWLAPFLQRGLVRRLCSKRGSSKSCKFKSGHAEKDTIVLSSVGPNIDRKPPSPLSPDGPTILNRPAADDDQVSTNLWLKNPQYIETLFAGRHLGLSKFL